MKKQILILTITTLVFCAAERAAAQTPVYAITQSVIASGGGQNSTGTSAGGSTYSLAGTIGQAVAGQPAANGSLYNLNAGFWQQNLAPTAAGVSVGGRITTASGAGIRNVAVTLVDASGAARAAHTGAGGYYSFTDVPAGATYLITVFAKRFRFGQPSQIRSITEDVSDVNFTAENNSVSPSPPILMNSQN